MIFNTGGIGVDNQKSIGKWYQKAGRLDRRVGDSTTI